MSTRGRPSKFKPEFVEQAEKLCLLGATDEEMADFFDVDVRSVLRWKKEKPDFCQAIKEGKIIADREVAEKLHAKATGYRWLEQQAIKVKNADSSERVEIVELEREVPPDSTAIIFWLKNRRRHQWRDVQDHKHGGTVEHKHTRGDIEREVAESFAAPEPPTNGKVVH